MRVDDALHDREAEPGAAVLARGRRVDLIERVEDLGALDRRDPDARVGDANLDLLEKRREERRARVVVVLLARRDRGLGHASVHRDLSALWRELHRVVDEVDEHLTQALGVGGELARDVVGVEHELDLLLPRHGRQRRDDLLQDRSDLRRRLPKAHRAALELREIEEAHDEAKELLALRVDRTDVLLLLGSERTGDALGEHLAVTDDRRELVAHRREEVRLETIDLLQARQRLLEPCRFVLQLAVALAHAVEVELARHPGLVAREDDELERLLHVRRDALERLLLHPRDLRDQLARPRDVEPLVGLSERRRRLTQPRRRVRTEHDAPDATALVLERHDAIGEAGEARMRHLAIVAWGDAPRSAHGRAARRAGAGELVDVPAQLMLRRHVREEHALGRIDAHSDAEQLVDALAEVLERLAIDDVLERDRLIADDVVARGDLAHAPAFLPPTYALQSSRARPG